MDQEQEEVIWSKPSIHDTFSFQLGFSMTVHKDQGRTIDKVVLDLHYKSNHRKQLELDGILVALSRARCFSSILWNTFQDSSQLLM
jgi:ATP-dependent exoDNAse (exonuclease V) alpha subunit